MPFARARLQVGRINSQMNYSGSNLLKYVSPVPHISGFQPTFKKWQDDSKCKILKCSHPKRSQQDKSYWPFFNFFVKAFNA